MPQGYLRAALESTPGNEVNTPTLSTKKVFVPIESYGPKLGAGPLLRDDELRNLDEPVAAITDRYDPSWDMAVRAYPDIIAFFFTHQLGSPTTVAGDGVITDQDGVAIPTGAYRHRWVAPYGPAGQSPNTAQIDAAYTEQTVWLKSKGAAIAETTIESPEEGGVMLNFSGPAAYLNAQSDPALTPAYESLAIRPFVRGNLSLPTWLTGSGGHEDVTLKIESPVETYSSLGVASKWPDSTDKSNEGTIVFSGELSQRVLDPEDFAALRDVTGFPATMRWVNDSIIASGYPYKFYVVFANAQYVEGDPEPLGNKRRHGGTFQFRGTSASGTGSTTVEVCNATASYA